ncbi:MAG: alanine racemase [Microbacterium sp.]
MSSQAPQAHRPRPTSPEVELDETGLLARSLRSVVLSTKPLKAGEGVSYGYRHRASRDTTVALVACGYAQGVVRCLGGVAHVDINGVRRPIIGRVAMDVCVVDVDPALGEVAAGDPVIFFGDGAVAEELQVWSDASGLTLAELASRAAGGRGVPLRVDEVQLRTNIRAVKQHLQPADLMVVVKDNAYGHGVERMAAAALDEDVAWIGAFDVATGVRVRAVAPEARVFSWLTVGGDEIDEALDARLDLGVGDADYLERVAARATASHRSARVHLKIDTGLHRNGVRPEAWGAFVERAAALEREGALHVVGIWSHIAEASDEEDDLSRAEFDRAVAAARAAGLDPEVRHLAASAAGWHRPEFRYDLVRVGAFCYGIRSADGPEIPGTLPAASVCATVAAVHDDTVEVGIGSLDGLFSTLGGRVSAGTPAGARALRAVGETVSIIDGWPGAAIGDEVFVFGPGDTGESSATTLAETIDTVGEEVVLRLAR